MSHLRRVACVRVLKLPPHSATSGVLKLAEACFRFTSLIALQKNEVIFLEVGKSLKLFSEETIRARIFILAQRLGLEVRVMFASNLCGSFVKVHYPELNGENFSNLPIEAAVYFLDPFDLDPVQLKKAQALINTMKDLGIKTFAQFFELPSQSLGSRFGGVAVKIYSYAKGLTEPAWREFRPSLIIEEFKQLEDDELEGSEVTLEPLLFSLKSLIDRAMTRLVGLGQRASRVLIELQLSPWSTIESPWRRWDISLAVAQGTSVGLLPIIREKLSFELSRKPLSAPARFLKFKILESVPGHSAQKDFFHAKEVEAESWDQLLGRLMSQLGEGNVFHAALVQRYRPEANWIRTLVPKEKRCKKLSVNTPPTQLHSSESNQDRNFRPQRFPSRILKTPEPLLLKPSLVFHCDGRVWKIQSWEGPERISSEWWLDSSELNSVDSADSLFMRKVNRDYFRLMTQDNEKLWVFFDRETQPAQAFLHGYFD